MEKSPTVLVIDDDEGLRYSLERVLSSREYKVMTADSGETGVKIAEAERPRVILLDNRMTGMSGIETLQHLRHTNPDAMVILMTAFGTTQTAIEAMKFGAFDYIIKPFDTDKLLALTEKAYNAYEDVRKGEKYTPLLNTEDYKEGIVGNSEPMQEVFKAIGQVAASDATVMITGESGTGKELIARCVFQHSHRSSKPFIAVNCAAIPENLIESELFGHEKGSFTGATTQRRGKFELCDTGTIFLDEIGDMTLNTQTKILRAIQEGEIQRVGGTETIKVDVRLIAATNKNLEKLVEHKEFREDLYYRLNVVRLRLPALRERLDDVPSLVDYMLQKMLKGRKTRARRVSQEAMAVLCGYPWPGNVRELENAVYRSAVVAQGDTILRKDLPEDVVSNAKPVAMDAIGSRPPFEARAPELDEQESSGAVTIVPPREATAPVLPEHLEDAYDMLYKKLRESADENLLGAVEEAFIKRALAEMDGNQVKTAGLLGMTRSTLRKRISSMDI